MKINKPLLIVLILIVASISARARAGTDGEDTTRLVSQVQQALAQKYPQARVEVVADLVAARGRLPAEAERVSLISENGRGEATLLATTAEGTAEIRATYQVWMDVRVANRRIMPNEALSEAAFAKQEVDLARGQPFVYRGVILSSREDLARLETRQSILEGQFLTQSAVQKTPDLKRGDWVKIQLNSGALQLTTTGNAAEPGFTRAQVRVVTTKSKRELAGILRPDGVVEVKL
jgi:flagella basal body P-ring formation protein FlgA